MTTYSLSQIQTAKLDEQILSEKKNKTLNKLSMNGIVFRKLANATMGGKSVTARWGEGGMLKQLAYPSSNLRGTLEVIVIVSYN